MKQRLLGALILVALLVILVPELLDGAGHKARYAKQLQIPDEPVFQPMPVLPVPESTRPAAPLKEIVKSPPLVSWALQLGSFSDPENARVFRDKLRAESYPAYINIKKMPDRKIWRVRVGPELDKSRLEPLKKRILKQYKIQAMIVKHQ